MPKTFNPTPKEPMPKYTNLRNKIDGSEVCFVNKDGVTYRLDDPYSPRITMSRHIYYQFINALCTFMPWEVISVSDKQE